MQVDFDGMVRTLGELVRINSINPAFSGGTTDERMVAAYVAGRMEALGMEVHSHEAAPGRVSVVGRLRGTGGGRSLMLYAHHDTVGIEGMPDPWSAEVRDGRMYGRGAYDMKCGLAACLAAVQAITRTGVPLLMSNSAGMTRLRGSAGASLMSLPLRYRPVWLRLL